RLLRGVPSRSGRQQYRGGQPWSRREKRGLRHPHRAGLIPDPTCRALRPCLGRHLLVHGGQGMRSGQIAELSGRGVVAVSGPDAAAFLDNLFTSDASKAVEGHAVYGGLLTPQGKILFDFIVLADGERYLIDIDRRLVADFVKRVGSYKLRAKVEIAD